MVAIFKIVIMLSLLLLAVAYVTWLERKVLGRMQVRHGPMRVGWHGLLQPIADGVKLATKELIVPTGADRSVFLMAPVIALVFAFVPFVIIPFAAGTEWQIMDLNVGVLFVLAASSLGTYGIVLGGWGSNSKYSMMGALRSVAQMISYEVPMILALVGPVMMSGSLSMSKIIDAQSSAGYWFIFTQPLAFVIYLISGVAETNRVPFDMVEAEGELVCGFHTEYSGMAFSVFFLAEYANMILISVLATICFLGGWHRPFPAVEFLSFLDIIPGIGWFSLKVFFFLFFYIWIRATLPRIRYDQLMYLGWKILLPLSLINILLMGIYRFYPYPLIVLYIVTFISTIACVAWCSKYFYE